MAVPGLGGLVMPASAVELPQPERNKLGGHAYDRPFPTRRIAGEHLVEVERKIADLEVLGRELSACYHNVRKAPCRSA